jgi:RHS repeat-associated protein
MHPMRFPLGKLTTLVVAVAGLLLLGSKTTAAQAVNAPIVQIMQRGGVVAGASSMQVTFYLCGDAYGYDLSTLRIKLNDVDASDYFTSGITSTPTWLLRCPYREQYTGTIPLTLPTNALLVTVKSQVSPYSPGGDYVEYRLPSKPRAVTVTTPAYIDAPISAMTNPKFKLTNTGAIADTFSLALSCTGQNGTCALPGGSSLILGAGQSTSVNANVPMPGTAGANVIAKLTAGNLSSTASATGTAEITAVATPVQGVVLATSPDYQDRSLCTRVAVAGGAIQCGDLMIEHPLHTLQTMNHTWQPRLIYNSQTAAPNPTIAANVTITGSQADLVSASLIFNGAQVATAQWSGADWGANSTRRIAMSWNAVTVQTGSYPYTLEISRWNGGVRAIVGTITGRMNIVNRSTSQFGAGWWLSGLEALKAVGNGPDLLWIGGDGGSRVYVSQPNNRWVATNITVPDTLIWNPTTAIYSRMLPGRGHVDFNAAGQQIATVNRSGFGCTFYYYPSGEIWRFFMLPSDPNNWVRYSFNPYPTVNSIVAVGTGEEYRYTTIRISNGIATSITNYDDGAHLYRYEGSPTQPQRIVASTDPRGVRTAYTYSPGFTVSSASTPTGAGDTVRTSYLDSRARGLVVPGSGTGTSESLDSTFSRIDGPRTDLVDISGIWENALGAPTRTRDALGNGSKITYSQTWPGLAAEVHDPAHFVQTSAIDPPTGLITSTVAANPFGDGRAQTTTYTWDTFWRVLTNIKNPAGDSVQMGYDGAGNRIWQQPGGDVSRRVTFGYNARRQVDTVSAPGAPPLLIGYDSLGNIKTTTSPLGWTTTTIGDAFGRQVLATSPIDASHSTTDSTEYDGLGRVASTTTRGPAMNGAPADSIRLEYEYDAAGNRTAVNRRFLSSGSWQRLRHTWSYDGLGRLDTEVDDDGLTTTLAYDLAGNVITRTSPRNTSVSFAYDAANRVVQSVHSPVAYAPGSCDLPSGISCYYSMPTRGTSVTIVPDTSLFRYDGAGRMTAANNRYARIARSFAPNGTLVTDMIRIRRVNSRAPSPGEESTEVNINPYFPDNWYGDGAQQQSVGEPVGAWTLDLKHATREHGRATGANAKAPHSSAVSAGTVATSQANSASVADVVGVGNDEDFANYVYWVSYHYDLDGRRDTLYSSVFSGGKQSYRYNAVTGDLDATVDVLGNTHTVTRDVRGRLKTQDSPGWHVDRDYDDDDNLTAYNGVTISVDALGRPTWANAGVGVTNSYDGLGHLIQATGESADATVEQFGYDALGNRNYSHRGVPNPAEDDGIRYTTTSLTGRVSQVTANPANQLAFWMEQNYGYEGENAAFESSRLRKGSVDRYWQSRSYYGADDKLRVFNRHTGIDQPSEFFGQGQLLPVFEEYWYDALGRRVVVRSRHPCPASADTECMNVVKHTIWDGDQVLQERRASAADTTAANSLDVGSDATAITYTHLMGIDAPVAVMKGWTTTVIPHQNWRAVFDTGHVVGGGSPPAIRWPGSTETLDHAPSTFPRGQYEWFGDVIGGQTDGSGQKYMRNRYYDPAKGTFTQKDPIGLAGGVNLYGFAGGDPVNYSDPFGLKGCPTGEVCGGDEYVNAAKQAVASFIDGAINILGSIGNSIRDALPGLAVDAGVQLAASVVPVVGEVRAGRSVVAVSEAAGRFLTENRHVRTINEARKDFSRIGATAEEVSAAVARGASWESLAAGATAGGRISVGRGVVQYTMKNVGREVIFNAWIPK